MQNRLFLVICLCCSLLACESEPRPTRSEEFPIPDSALRLSIEGAVGGTLRYPLLGEPRTFNPTAATDSRSLLISSLFNATLLEFDGSQQTVGPGIAERWQVSEDHKTVDLFIRKGLRFGDGSELTVGDVTFTLERIFREESSNSIRTRFLSGDQRFEFEAVSENHVQLRLAKPDSAIEYYLCSMPVLPKHLLSQIDSEIEAAWNLETPVDMMTGLGPFLIDVHVPGIRTVLRRNPHYWKVDREGIRLPYLDGIEIHFIADANNQVLRLRNGDLDLIDHVLTSESLEMLRAPGSGAKVTDFGPSNKSTLLWFNLHPSLEAPGRDWFAGSDFRRAVSLAIDRDQIAKIVFKGQAQGSKSIIPKGNRYWPDSDFGLRHDLREARRLLARSGFSWRKGDEGDRLFDAQGNPVGFQLSTTTDQSLGLIGQLLQQDLAQIGIELSIQTEELRSLIGRVLGSRAYDAALASFSIPSLPSDYASALRSNGPMHLWNPGQEQPATDWEARLDEIMSAARSNIDTDEQRRAYKEVLEILGEKLPMLPIVNWNVTVASSAQLDGIRPAREAPYSLWNAWELHFDR